MSKPFDATAKQLLENHPRDWLRLLLGREVSNVRVLNVDLSSVTTEADFVLQVEEPVPWIVHVEFQTSHDPTLPHRLQRYNILVNYRHELPVQSVVLLLRPQADSPDLSGLLQHHLPDGILYHEFRYNVIRIWERPAEELVEGSLGTLPLAPIAKVAPTALPGLIRRMEQRIESETSRNEAADLWIAAFLLAGLIYPKDFARTLFQGVRAMKESATYQAILEEGREEGLEKGRLEGRQEGETKEAVKILIKLGTRRLGPPAPPVLAKIGLITDLETLEELVGRAPDAKNWEDLLSSL